VSSLEEKVDQLLTDVAVVKDRLADLPALADRVSALEAWKWRAAGGAGVLIAVGLPVAGLVMSR
jgi:hypothetical protein